MIRFIFALALFAAPVGAQTWTASTSANGSLLFGAVSPPEWSMGFGCTAPAPEGRPLIETGSHESHRTEAFEITVGFLDSLFQWAPPYEISGIVVSVDNVSYQLPPLGLNELQGSAIYLPMTDHFVLALFDAQRLVLDTGQGTAYEYPVDGLSDALLEMFSYCSARWVEIGHRLPDSLAALGIGGQTEARAPVSFTPQQTPVFVEQMMRQGCNGGYSIDRSASLGEADFDSDGLPDYIFSGYGTQCDQGVSPFCGASQCSVGVHLSSRGYAEVDGWIGGGFQIEITRDGPPGLRRFGDPARALEVWDGTVFVPID